MDAHISGEGEGVIYQEAEDWYMRYEFTRGKRKSNVPTAEWQRVQYLYRMGRKPPANKDDWQWEYNPRSKESKNKLKEFIDGNV